MKKSYSLKYVSGRVLCVFLIVLIFMILQAGEQAVLLSQHKTTLWKLLLYILIMGIYLLVGWFWVWIPYQRSEKLTKRIIEGHIISDSQIFDSVLLTPLTKPQLEKMEEMMKSPWLMDQNKRRVQYLALQNQINPHFLYNTLESIRGEALIAGLDSVADMTEALAKFFRYTITNVENLVSVEEELDNCENYFRIQQYRFGDRLRLHVECEEEERQDIMNCRIPKLTLQPILENSIIHGTEQKIGTSNLKIKFESTGRRLIIRISDDGVGMDEMTLAKLNSKLGRTGKNITDNGEKQKGGIALANVNNRIQLVFGEEYGMHIYSIPQKGTDVEVTIPITSNKIVNRGII